MKKVESTDNEVFGLEDNIAGALAYIGGFITGLIFYFAEEDNKFVRFHALQSILLSIPLFILSIIWSSLWSWMSWYAFGWYTYGLTYWISNLVWILTWVIILLMMSKAYQGKEYMLPIIGDIAKKNA